MKMKVSTCLASSFYCLILAACGAPALRAQALDVKIEVTSLSPPRVVVEGARQGAVSDWSFRNAYAGLIGVGERINNLSLSDENGVSVEVRKVAPGEYTSGRAAVRYRYEVHLSPPVATASAAHVSWLTSENGVLMLGDLLPLKLPHSIRVHLMLPAKWKAISAETTTDGREFASADVEHGVFYIARELRELRARIGGADFVLGVSGTWAFSDGEALGLMKDIIGEHRRVTGTTVKAGCLTVLAPFPSAVSPFTWSAETRGRTVFLLSGRVPSKSAALAHLSVPLAHELFHLWVPNGLSLSGDYDWFYEGWTSYQAMRVGMTLGYLNFQDYLNALGRAFDGYKSSGGATQLSLLDLSKRRWTGAQRLLYNKGMLTAFLFDLSLRQRTKGKQSVDNVYRELFHKHGAGKDSADGNNVIRDLLNSMLGISSFTQFYIESSAGIDLPTALRPFGLEVSRMSFRLNIYVAKSVTKQQNDLLRDFGYNAGVNSAISGTRVKHE